MARRTQVPNLGPIDAAVFFIETGMVCGWAAGEDICVIRKKDERKVLTVCALGRYHFVNPGCANKLNYRTASKCIQSLRPW